VVSLAKRSNRKLIHNAISYVCLEVSLDAIASLIVADSCHLLISHIGWCRGR
jgi:hypothetical protein